MTDSWTSLDRVIDAAPDANALRTHGMGPIAAWRMRLREETVPPEIEGGRILHCARAEWFIYQEGETSGAMHRRFG